MSFCDYCADWFIEHLERDIEAHESGRFDEIGVAERDAPEWDLIEDEIERHRMGVAYNFGDMWADARNHDWAYYPGVERDDWPHIARQICRGLRDNWTPQQMMNNEVFDPP